jgi:hypothetical protein
MDDNGYLDIVAGLSAVLPSGAKRLSIRDQGVP